MANFKKKTLNQNSPPLLKKPEYPSFVDQVHGLPLALFSKTCSGKIFWWFVFLSCTGCGMLTIFFVVVEYGKLPTSITMAIKLVPSLELPAITICPKEPDALNFDPLLKNIQKKIPNLTNDTAIDLISYWLAGSGLAEIFPAYSFNESRIKELNEMYKIWSDGYDTKTFFHKIQSEYGYKCEDLFDMCNLNVKAMDCCKEVFRPIWVLKQGLCYQTRRGINQTNSDGIGWLNMVFKPLPSVAVKTGSQPALIVHVNDNFEHVVHNPRYYLFPNEDNTMHLKAKFVELLEHRGDFDCTTEIVGKDALCYVREWTTFHLLNNFNCTLPYLQIPGISNDTKICDPLTIMQHYIESIDEGKSLGGKRCIPGCTKWEYDKAIVSRASRRTTDYKHWFHLAIGYDELQYEHVKEVSVISLPGLISQIGGQLGLYLGLSIVTILQIVIYVINKIFCCLCPCFARKKSGKNKVGEVKRRDSSRF